MKALPLLAAAVALVLASGAQANTVKQACTRNLDTGAYEYDSSGWSSDYIVTVVAFKENYREGGIAYGICTIDLKYQPPN